MIYNRKGIERQTAIHVGPPAKGRLSLWFRSDDCRHLDCLLVVHAHADWLRLLRIRKNRGLSKANGSSDRLGRGDRTFLQMGRVDEEERMSFIQKPRRDTLALIAIFRTILPVRPNPT